MKKEWKKRIGVGFLAVVLMTLFGIGMFRAGEVRGASGNEPGTAADPIITKSYLDMRLAELNGGTTVARESFERVALAKGEILTVKSGGELVLYSGNTSVIGESGLIDLTTGELFKEGNSLVRYNQYLSPEDGCGLQADGKAVVFVKGEYAKE